MRLLQKIEIGLGVAFFVSLLASFYLIDLPLAQSVAEMRNEPINLRILFLFNILPGIIVATCTYFHVIRRSLFAFFASFAVCGLITFLLLATTLLGNAFMGRPLIGTLPMFIGFATMIVAVTNTIYFIREDRSDLGKDTNTNLRRSYWLELFFAASAFLVAVVRICVEFFTQSDIKRVIVPMFLVVFLAPFLTIVGAYFQAIRKNDIGLVIIFPGFLISLFLELVSGRLVEIVRRIYYSGLFIDDFYYDIPYLLVFVSMVFALNSLRLKYRLF